MAHIEVREKSDGKKAFKAEVVVTVEGKRHKRSATFSTLTTAKHWAAKKEIEMRTPGGIEKLCRPSKPVTVADAVGRYIDAHKSALKQTKYQVLSFVSDRRCDFSERELREIQSYHIREFAEELANGGREPPTVSSYLTHVCHVLAVAEDDFGPKYHVSLDALTRGKVSARRAGLAGKSKARERRPTLEELDKLMEYFIKRSLGNNRALPMALIVAFAIFGVRRQSEITALKWADLEGDELLVRGMKDPRNPDGRDCEQACKIDPVAGVIGIQK